MKQWLSSTSMSKVSTDSPLTMDMISMGTLLDKGSSFFHISKETPLPFLEKTLCQFLGRLIRELNISIGKLLPDLDAFSRSNFLYPREQPSLNFCLWVLLRIVRANLGCQFFLRLEVE